MTPLDLLCQPCTKIGSKFIAKPGDINSHDNAVTEITWNTLLPDQCNFCQLICHCIRSSGDVPQPFCGRVRGVFEGQELQLYLHEDNGSRKLDYSILRCAGKAIASDSEFAQEIHSIRCTSAQDLASRISEAPLSSRRPF